MKLKNNAWEEVVMKRIVKSKVFGVVAVATVGLWAGLALASSNGDVQDKSWNVVAHIEGDDIKDKSWNVVGHVEGNDIKDKSWNVVGHIEGGDIKDKSWNVVGHIEGNDIKDKSWNVIGHFEGGGRVAKGAAGWFFFL